MKASLKLDFLYCKNGPHACVRVCERACVCVCVVYEDTNLYNDMGMT